MCPALDGKQQLTVRTLSGEPAELLDLRHPSGRSPDVELEAGSGRQGSVGVGVKQAAVAAFVLLRHSPDHQRAVPQPQASDRHLVPEVRVHPWAKVLVTGGHVLLPLG